MLLSNYFLIRKDERTCCVLDATSTFLQPSSPDPSKFDATNILAYPSSIIAEQLTKIETVRRLRFCTDDCAPSITGMFTVLLWSSRSCFWSWCRITVWARCGLREIRRATRAFAGQSEPRCVSLIVWPTPLQPRACGRRSWRRSRGRAFWRNGSA